MSFKMDPIVQPVIAVEPAGNIDFNVMFPELENHEIRYVFHVCGLRDIPSQTRLIEFEGIDEVNDLANYTDSEIDQMADRNAKRNPAAQRVQFGLKRTKYLKAVCHWVRKNAREGTNCDVRELTPLLISNAANSTAGTEANDQHDASSTIASQNSNRGGQHGSRWDLGAPID